MIVDETYPVELGTAAITKKDGSRLWRIRFDLVIPPKDYRKIDSVLHAAIDLFYKNDDSGFRNIQWSIKWPTLYLLFDEEKKNLVGDVPAKGVAELSEVDLKPQTIVCWKKVTVTSADGEDKEEERTLVMQVRADISNTKKNTDIIQRFAQSRAFCRIRRTESDLFEKKTTSPKDSSKKSESEKGAKADTATPMVRAALLACAKALPGESIFNTDDLVAYLAPEGRTEQACRAHLKKLIANGSGPEGTETQTKDLIAYFMPRKIVLKNVGDIQSEVVSATWAELYEMITALSIKLKSSKT